MEHCRIRLSKLSNYSVVSSSGVLTVNPAPLTAAATSTSRVYGHANPSLSGNISGLKNNDPISATFASTADLNSAVGTFPILPVFNDPAGKLGNYTVNATGTLTVTQQPLSVTLANATRVYGDPNPVFTGSINGIRNNDNITLAPTTTADPTSPVGTYAIVAGFNNPAGKIGNYAVSSNTATLTVTPAPLTIQAANASAPVGGPFPTFHRDHYRFEERRRNHGVLQHNGNCDQPGWNVPDHPRRKPEPSAR